MTSNGQNTPPDEGRNLLADLHRLLAEQIVCAREGHFARVEALSVQADAIVTKMMQCGNQTATTEGASREDLERLYSELTLMLKAEQVDVQGNLRQLRQVKRAVGAYGGRGRLPSQVTRSGAAPRS